MRFRFHRGTLEDSLKTLVNFKNKEELYKIICDSFKDFDFKFNIENIEFKHQGYDERCNWDTYLVHIKNYGVIGQSDGRA